MFGRLGYLVTEAPNFREAVKKARRVARRRLDRQWRLQQQEIVDRREARRRLQMALDVDPVPLQGLIDAAHA